eukprot:TRINITY_DN3445_c0_g1_i10.p1 TRINITY_DN3445_c0_g1~~TRINITY_DN3445_c0_g1_i10.p1  ORF type:complete len:613 (+),score=107.18 TRINITY_DN3445_c0_g1_i10:82-1839(+)
MARVASIVFAALASRELLAQPIEACNSQAERPSKAKLTQGLSLVQLNDAERARGLLKKRHRSAVNTGSVALDTVSDAALAKQIRSHFLDFGNIGTALTGGLGSIMKAIPAFTSEIPQITTPQINQGFGAMGEDLLDVIMSMIPGNQAGELEQFSEMFMKIFEDLPSAVPELTSMLGSFHETGNEGALIEAFDKVLEQVGMQVADILPSGSGLEIANYVGSLKELLEAVGDGSGELSLGDVDSAIRAIAGGVLSATTELAPAGSNVEGALSGIMGQLDPGIGGFFDMVGGFQHKLEQSNVCWKSEDTVLREKVLPNICPENYEFDGHHWCVAVDVADSTPATASLLEAQAVQGSACSSTADCHYQGCDQPDLVLCWENVCYTGTYNPICYGAGMDMHDLGDGGWCYQGRRDIRCPARPTAGSPSTTATGTLDPTQESTTSAPATTTAAGASSSTTGPSSSTRPANPRRPTIVLPHCDAESEFPERMGSWCYKACPQGSEPSGPNNHNCKATCGGAYPFSDSAAPLLCGKTAQAMQQAVMHMVGSSMQTVIGGIIGGLTMVGLPGTVNSMIEMGKSFAHPKCPIGEQ